MQVDETREGTVIVLAPREGRLDAQRALAFKEAITQRVDAGNYQLVLDLALVEFMDSSGLGAVVAVLKRLGFKGSLVICGARALVSALFQLTRMDKVIKMVATREEAVAAILADASGPH